MKLVLLYTIFREESAIARSARFENMSQKSVQISRAMSLSLDLPDCDYDWIQFSGAWARERQVKIRHLEQGIQAVEEAVNAERSEISVQDIKSSREVREGTSADTVVTPEDFPMEYDYGSGRISDWSREDMLKKTPSLRETKPS